MATEGAFWQRVLKLIDVDGRKDISDMCVGELSSEIQLNNKVMLADVAAVPRYLRHGQDGVGAIDAIILRQTCLYQRMYEKTRDPQFLSVPDYSSLKA